MLKILLPLFAAASALGAPKVDFARDVQPILHARCAGCHSGEKPQAELSVFTRAGLLKGGRSGAAIVPGSSERSLLVLRITGQQTPLMPLSGSALTAPEIEALKAWIDQGAEWRRDTTELRPLASLALHPPALRADSPGNPIDSLLDAYFRAHHIVRPPPVPDDVFVRRVYLDLWGLLPSPEQRAEFLEDRSAGKRERLIGQLLANRKNYAGHWISYWNDLLRNEEGARYGGSFRKSITPWLLEALEEQFALRSDGHGLAQPGRECSAGRISGRA